MKAAAREVRVADSVATAKAVAVRVAAEAGEVAVAAGIRRRTIATRLVSHANRAGRPAAFSNHLQAQLIATSCRRFIMRGELRAPTKARKRRISGPSSKVTGECGWNDVGGELRSSRGVYAFEARFKPFRRIRLTHSWAVCYRQISQNVSRSET